VPHACAGGARSKSAAVGSILGCQVSDGHGG
jgi:hypothetical protein